MLMACFEAMLDEVAWLYNLRGNEYAIFVLSQVESLINRDAVFPTILFSFHML